MKLKFIWLLIGLLFAAAVAGGVLVLERRTPALAAPSVVLIGAGDLGDCSNDSTEHTAELVERTPGLVITIGDNVYPDGTPQEFADCYARTWGRFLDRTRPAAGNHDYRTRGAAGYYQYFGATAGDPARGYYSYDYGAWHAVVLNSNCDAVGGCGAGSPQLTWLAADLDAHPALCTLAYWHHPLFSSGEHGGNEKTRDFWRVLYDHHADLVLNGHDHDYERFRPLNPDGLPDVRGLREIVVGTGGAYLYQQDRHAPNSEAFNDERHGVIKLTLRADSYDWEFVPSTPGAYSDPGSAACNP